MEESQTGLPKIVYVARDIERALGFQPSERFRIVANHSQYAETIRAQYPAFVTLVEPGKNSDQDVLDTADLLVHPVTKKIIGESRAAVLVFKNTPQIETICKTSGWTLLNPSATLSENIENKLTQVAWLGDLARYLPPTRVALAKNLTWNEEPFVLQWAHGHTGSSTTLVSDAKTLAKLQTQFPDRTARTSRFIQGPSFTVNVVITPNKILSGNVSYQITGLEPFTDNVFSTVGNDWSITHSLLNDKELDTLERIVQDVGLQLQQSGWKGLVGFDFVLDGLTREMYLIELNARQPASTTFESMLQNTFRAHGMTGITMFEAHVAALCGVPVTEQPLFINDGAQIVQRITAQTHSISDDVRGALQLAGYAVIVYDNTTPNSDLVRVQSELGLMQGHGTLNARGKAVAETLNPNSASSGISDTGSNNTSIN